VHKCLALTLVFLCSIAAVGVSAPVCAQETSAGATPEGTAGIDEQLGGYVPMDLVLVNEDGDSVKIGDLIDRPTIVSLVYYSCPSVCRPLLDEVTDMLGKLQDIDMTPGDDYRVLTISFDDTDSPAGSARLKNEYYDRLPDGFPAQAWTFLTGDAEAVARFTESVGFRFRRAGEDFAHPTTLVILSPDGKITRYMYGAEYLAVDLKMAVLEARKGVVGPTIARFLKFCFSYDPEGRRFVLNTTRVVGLSTLIGLVSFAIFLKASGKRRKESFGRRKEKAG
jgi:protein SCO1/2